MGRHTASTSSPLVVWKGYIENKPIRITFDGEHWEWQSPQSGNPIPVPVTMHSLHNWFGVTGHGITLEKEVT